MVFPEFEAWTFAGYIYIPLFGVLVIAFGISLYFLRGEDPALALLDACLILLLLYSFWAMILSLVTIFIARKTNRINNNR